MCPPLPSRVISTLHLSISGALLRGMGPLVFGPCKDNRSKPKNDGFVGFMSEVIHLSWTCSPAFQLYVFKHGIVNIRIVYWWNAVTTISHQDHSLSIWSIWVARWQNQQNECAPAKTQISLGIRPVWSESSLCTQWVDKDSSFLHADGEDSDQTGRMPRLIWVLAGRTLILFSHVVAHIFYGNPFGV